MGLVIPSIDTQQNVKSAILSLLLHGHPLTVKKIHNALKRKWAFSVTYQAVHKAVHNLYGQNILTKSKKGYVIKNAWVNQLEEFIKTFKQNYLKEKGLKEAIWEGNTQILTFATFEDAENYRKKLQQEFFSKPGAKIFAQETPHIRSPLIYSEKSLTLLNLVKQYNAQCYILTAGNTAIDEWCADYYRQSNVKVKTGIDCAQDCQIMVMNDTIVQMYIPSEISKAMDEIYAKAKKVGDISVPDLHRNVYKKKTNVKMIITKNKELAEHVKDKIIGSFE